MTSDTASLHHVSKLKTESATLEMVQHEHDLRTRVHAVSLRRRPSDDADSSEGHRSSLKSRSSHASARSAPTTNWIYRPHHALYAGSTLRLVKQPSFRDQFEDDRCSLPTLESHHAEESSKRGHQATSPAPAHYVPHSPVPSSCHSVPQKRANNETKGAMITEVDFILPMFTTSKAYQLRRDNSTEPLPPESKTPFHAMQYYMHTAPHVSIEETHKYTFAIVLKHTEQIFHLLKRRFPSRSSASIRRDLPHQVSALQQKCVRRLIQAGLHVVILDNALYDQYLDDQRGVRRKRPDHDGAQNLCLLINPNKTPDLLLHEFKREVDELAIKRGDALGRLAEESLDSLKTMCFSPALELQLTHNIIHNAFLDYDKDEWVIDVTKELTVRDVLVECFPLHDRAFNKRFFDEYRKRTFELHVRKAAAGNSDRWAVEELRLHFGERVAFLFAFMHIYNKHLLPLTLSCLFYYLCFRFTSAPQWRQYMQGLTVIGLFVVCFWGPSFLVCWARETRLLVEKWKLAKYQNTVYERNDENPGFQYVWVKNQLTHEMEKIPKQRKNHWIQLTMLVFVLISAVIQCLCLVPFIQWYVYAKNAPTCVACEGDASTSYPCMWFVTCFMAPTSSLGTDRWGYILLQGILLGLLIDIIFFELFNWMSEKFVQWENYAKKSEHENRLIHRRFVFVWTNWFFWFLFISFVYMPFGDTILHLFHQMGLGALAPYDWNPNLLTLDTLFVTPLVVTQLLNMLLETIAPYLLRKLRGRPSLGCRQAYVLTSCMHRIARYFGATRTRRSNLASQASRSTTAREQGDDRRNLTPTRLAQCVAKDTGFHVDVVPMSDDSNHYTAYEILAEAKLPIFDPMLDYLDACIQFSYVMMFTVVWPLLPLPAFCNNILEVRGDAFRLLFANRRPMPRRDTSIGEWATVLAYANIVGVTVVSAFVVVYHFGFFVTTCNFTFGAAYVIPFGTIDPKDSVDPRACKNESGSSQWRMYQIVLFVVLEHVSFCMRYLVLQIDKTPSLIRSSGFLRLKQIQQLTATKAAPPSQLEYVQRLRVLFDQYDVDGDGHLAELELVPFLAAWLCKHSSELLPYSGLIFRYMDKNKLGRVPFSTCCLMMQHVNHDRFFSCLLGLYDPLHGAYNEEIRRTCDPIELRRVLSEVSEVQRQSASSRASNITDVSRPRDSTFFYLEN